LSSAGQTVSELNERVVREFDDNDDGNNDDVITKNNFGGDEC